jgi:hypothetical protein
MLANFPKINTNEIIISIAVDTLTLFPGLEEQI